MVTCRQHGGKARMCISLVSFHLHHRGKHPNMPNDSNNFCLVCHLDIFSYMLMITFKKSQHRGFLSTQISTSAPSPHPPCIRARLEVMYITCAARASSYKEEKCKEMEMCHLKEVARLAKSRQVGGACGDGWVCFPLCTGR